MWGFLSLLLHSCHDLFGKEMVNHEPVIYHGMNCLPSLPLLILWSSFKKNSNSLRCSTQSSQGQHFIISFVLCNCFFFRSCDSKLWQFKKSSQFLQPMAHMQFLNAFVVVCL
jgi:hypothetical protein